MTGRRGDGARVEVDRRRADETETGQLERETVASERESQRQARHSHKGDRHVDVRGGGEARHGEPADRPRHGVVARCDEAGDRDDCRRAEGKEQREGC
jgi:hypothetical protein